MSTAGFFLTYVHVSFKLHLHLGLCENSLGAVLVFGLFFCDLPSSLVGYTRTIYLCHSWPLSSEQYSETHTVICRLAVKPF